MFELVGVQGVAGRRGQWDCGRSACVQEMEMRLISVKYAIISGSEHKQVCVYVHVNACLYV